MTAALKLYKDVNIMYVTVKEMTLLCKFHAGTFSETLAMLRNAEEKRPEIMAVVKSLSLFQMVLH